MGNNGHEANERLMSIRYSDNNFYLAVKQPLTEEDEGYEALSKGADTKRILQEGSQIFVYPKENFGPANNNETYSRFREFVKDTAREIGRVSLDKHILPVHVKGTHLMEHVESSRSPANYEEQF